ncbi:MAG: YlbF family regulator [Clostridiales bacterium]|jgi:hypothetical protein|nr:YlbF family regulator [Clostridiales bacterium]
MSVYTKARELTDAILASEESLRLADARALAEEGRISDNELKAAVNDLNALINEAMGIVRMGLGLSGGCGNCARGCEGE